MGSFLGGTVSVAGVLALGVECWALAIETSNPSAFARTGRETPGEGFASARGALGVAAQSVERATTLSGWIGVGEVTQEALDLSGARDDLLPAIQRLSARTGRDAAGLSLIVMSAGPGGFTALRVATAAAKMLALATGAEVVALATADALAGAWARRARAERGAGERAGLVVLLASKADSAFAVEYAAEDAARGLARGPGRLITAAEISGAATSGEGTDGSRAAGRVVVTDHFVPAVIATAARAAGMTIEAPEYDAAMVLELGFERAPVAAEALTPIYPREAEAVTKWRALRAARGT